MATLNQFNPVGAFQSARQNALTIQGQEQGIAREAAAAPVRNQLAELQLGQAQKTAQRGQTQFDQGQALQRAKIMNQAATALKGIAPENRAGAFTSLLPKLQEFGIDTAQIEQQPLTDENLDLAIFNTKAFLDNPEKAISDLDKAKADKLRAETGKLKAETQAELVGASKVTDISALTTGVSEELASKASAAFELSGGGDKGVKAAIKVIDTGTEQEKLKTAPLKLKTSYPNATPEEMTQLENVMSTAKTAESGFKEAGKLREKQRKTTKGLAFKDRAVALLDKILNNSETEDVTGSVEGGGSIFANFLLSDGESDAIADIEEAQDILTADNLSIMSGVLSETDIKIIANLAGGALNRSRGDERFRKEVSGLRDKLAGVTGSKTIVDLVNKYAN